MAQMLKKNFDKADESRQPASKITSDVVEISGVKLYRVTAALGWRWSVDLKPVLKTDSCPMDHLLYVISGKMRVKMDDGEELDFGPGDVAAIPAGHDGWDIANEPTVWLEIPH